MHTVKNKIPKLIHQLWLNEKNPPDKHLANINIMQTLHPTWDYKLWTVDDLKNEELLFGNIDDIIKRFNIETNDHPILLNILSIFILLKYGGVYCNIHNIFHHSLDHFSSCLFFCGIGGKAECVDPNLFGSVEQHRMLLLLIDKFNTYKNYDVPYEYKFGKYMFNKEILLNCDKDISVIGPAIWNTIYKYERRF